MHCPSFLLCLWSDTVPTVLLNNSFVLIQVSIQRLLAYIKRLCTVALHQSTPTSLALLAYARSFLQVNPEDVLENTIKFF